MVDNKKLKPVVMNLQGTVLLKLPPFSTLFEGLMHIPAGLSSRQILLFPAVQFGTGSPAESLI